MKSIESVMTLCMIKAGEAELSNDSLYKAYVNYCHARDWKPRERSEVLATLRQLWGLVDVRVKNIRSLQGAAFNH